MQFKQWLVAHIKTMLNFSGFTHANLLQTNILHPHIKHYHNPYTVNYRVLYFIDTIRSLDHYLENYAVNMRNQAQTIFANKFTVTREVHKNLANFTNNQHDSTQFIGAAAELVAKNFLIQQGLQWVASNYRCHYGEIDLIMQDGHYLSFIEVRKRRSAKFGGAIASITPFKQKKLIKTAQYYQAQLRYHYPENLYRFDVVTLQGDPPTIDWIKNCITLDR